MAIHTSRVHLIPNVILPTKFMQIDFLRGNQRPLH